MGRAVHCWSRVSWGQAGCEPFPCSGVPKLPEPAVGKVIPPSSSAGSPLGSSVVLISLVVFTHLSLQNPPPPLLLSACPCIFFVVMQKHSWRWTRWTFDSVFWLIVAEDWWWLVRRVRTGQAPKGSGQTAFLAPAICLSRTSRSTNFIFVL